MPEIESLYKAYKDNVQFFLVYIREAHPSRRKPTKPADDRRRPGGTTRRGPSIAQHKNINERVIAATQCIKDLKLSLPVLIDDMEGTFLGKYGGFPGGTVIVDVDGKIVFTSRGPRGAKPREAEKLLKALLAK